MNVRDLKELLASVPDDAEIVAYSPELGMQASAFALYFLEANRVAVLAKREGGES